ncbi:MAG TPA: YceI family protein [Gemmatimonadales bacterium]|nr:YceI family protein [Gemmatimonadales bacterium]
MISLRAWRRVAIMGFACVLGAPVAARAQVHWKVNSKASLAWWQIDPNMNHLWATTCPEEPSWRPGEGRSGGWSTNEAMQARVGHGFAAISDTVHVPLYPRRRVRFLCTEAVKGDFTFPDTVHWRGGHGRLTIDSKKITSGENLRDEYARDGVLATANFPELTFVLDSVTDVKRAGDTLRGKGWGVFTLRGVPKVVATDVKTFPEAGGLRVIGKFGIPAKALATDYGVTRRTLGLGVYMGIWKTLFMGVDLLLEPEQPPGAN